MEIPNIECATEDIKDVSAEPVCQLQQDSTKVEREFAEYLQGLKLPLDNGTTGPVVQQRCRDRSGKMLYVCYPCGVTLYGECMVQTHVRGKKHLCNLASRATWPESIHNNHNVENVTKNKDITPVLAATPSKSEVFKFDLSIVCNIQPYLDSYRRKSIIGLEYLVEILSNDDEGVQYNCVLCAKSGSLDKILQYHLVSSEHVLQYMLMHFNTVYIAIKANNLDWNPVMMQDITDKLSGSIENSYGRLRPVQCTKEQWKAQRTAICRTVAKREHFSEQLGKTFAEILTAKTVSHINKDMKPGFPSSDNKTITLRTVGKREHFTDKLITTSVPIVAVKPLQDFTRGADIRTIHASKNTAQEQTKEDVSKLDVVVSKEKKADNVSDRLHSQFGRSPLLEDNRTTPTISPEDRKKLFDKVKQYCERTQEELDTALKEMSFYEKMPEKHPQYPEEWVFFWNRRFMELRAENKDTTTHDFKSEWIKYWPKRLVHLHNARIESTKKALRKELGFPENKSPTRDLLAQLPTVHDRCSPRMHTQVRSQILRRRSRSPRKLYPSPRRRSRSPRKLYPSPRRRSQSPRRRSLLYKRRSRSPRKHSRSPINHSPRRRSPLPPLRKRSQSPSKQSRSPKRSLRRSRSPILERQPRSPLQRRLQPGKCMSSSESEHRQKQPLQKKQTRLPPTGRAKSEELLEAHNVNETRNLISRFDIPSLDDSRTSKMQEDVRVINSQCDINSNRLSEGLEQSNSKSVLANNSTLSRNRPHQLGCTKEIQSPCGTEIIPQFESDAKCGPKSSEKDIDCDDSNSCSSISTISTISSSICTSVQMTNRDCEGPRDIVPVLRLWAALEDYLGPSLGPGVLKVLAEALKMEKEKPNSSWNILQVDTDLTLLEMCKEKLRGKMEVGLLEDAALSASLEAIVRTTALLQRADHWKKRRQKEEETIQNRMNSLDKVTLLRNLEEALLRRGKTNVTTEELAILVDSVVDVREKIECGEDAQLSSKTEGSIEPETTTEVDSVITTENIESKISNDAYISKNETKHKETLSPTQRVDTGMDELSDDELQTLMKSFRHLSQDEQERLAGYINVLEVWNPKRMERLRQIMSFGPLQKMGSEVNTHEEKIQNSEFDNSVKEDSKSAVEGINDLKQNKIVEKSESDIKRSENTGKVGKAIDGSENTHCIKKEMEEPKQEKENETDITPPCQGKIAIMESYQNTKNEPQKSVYQMETKKQINIDSLQETHKKLENKSSDRIKKPHTENCSSQENETYQNDKEKERNREVEAENGVLISQQEEILKNTLSQCRKKRLENYTMAEDNNMSGVKKQKTENTSQRRKISLEDYLLTKRQKSESTAVVLAQNQMLNPENSRFSQNIEKAENRNSLIGKERKLKNTHIPLFEGNHKRSHSPATQSPQEKPKAEFSEEKEKKPISKVNIENKRILKNEESKNTHLPKNKNKPVNSYLLHEQKHKPVNTQVCTPQSKMKESENARSIPKKHIESKIPLMPLDKGQIINDIHSPQCVEQNLGDTHRLQDINKVSEKEGKTQDQPKQPTNVPLAQQNNPFNPLLEKEQNLDNEPIPEKKKESKNEAIREQPKAKNKFLLKAKYQKLDNTQQSQCEIKELDNNSFTPTPNMTPEKTELPQNKNNKGMIKVLIQQDKKQQTKNVVLPRQEKKKVENVFLPQQKKREAENVVLPQQEKKAAENVFLPQHKMKRAENCVSPQHKKIEAGNVSLPQQEIKIREAGKVFLPQQKNKSPENVLSSQLKKKEVKSYVLPQQKTEPDNVVLPRPTKKGADTVVLLQQKKKGAKNVEQKNKEAEKVFLPQQKKKELENELLPLEKKRAAKNVVLPQQKNKKPHDIVLPQQREAYNVALPQQKKVPDSFAYLQQKNKEVENVVLLQQKKKALSNSVLFQQKNNEAKKNVLLQQTKKGPDNVVSLLQKNNEAENVVTPQQKEKEPDNVKKVQQKNKDSKNVVSPQQKKKEPDNFVLLEHEKNETINVILPQEKKDPDNVVLLQLMKEGAENVGLPLQKKETEDVSLPQRKNQKKNNDLLPHHMNKEPENILLPQQKKEAEKFVSPQQNKTEADKFLMPQQNKKQAEKFVLPEQSKREAEKKTLLEESCRHEKKEAKIALLPHPMKQEAKTVLPKQEEEKSKTLLSPESFQQAKSFEKTKSLIEKSSWKPSNVSQQIPDNKKQESHKVTTHKSVATSQIHNTVRFTGKRLSTNCLKKADSVSSAKKAKTNTNSSITDSVWLPKKKAQNVAAPNKFKCGSDLHSQNNRLTFQRQNSKAQMRYQNEQVCYQREESRQRNQFQNPFSQERMSFLDRKKYSRNDFRERNGYLEEDFNAPSSIEYLRRQPFPDEWNFERQEQFSEDFNDRSFLIDRKFTRRCFENRDLEISQPGNFHRSQFLEPVMQISSNGFVNRETFHEDCQFLSMEGGNSEGLSMGFPGDIQVWDGRYANYP